MRRGKERGSKWVFMDQFVTVYILQSVVRVCRSVLLRPMVCCGRMAVGMCPKEVYCFKA